MRKKDISTIFIVLFLLFTLSCASQAQVVEDASVKNENTEEVLPAPPVEEKLQVEEKPLETPAEILDTEELKKAETDIAALIGELNNIITSKDFIAWQNYLSADYVRYYSDPEVLKERSMSPLLTKYKIVLRTIEDYFNFVVVGSRQNVKLDEVKVVDRDRIKAYMYVNNTPVIIYELIRIDDTWKIGKFLSGDCAF